MQYPKEASLSQNKPLDPFARGVAIGRMKCIQEIDEQAKLASCLVSVLDKKPQEGQKAIVSLIGQHTCEEVMTYKTVTPGDDEEPYAIWYRHDCDNHPIVSPHDLWMPLPKPLSQLFPFNQY